MVIPIRFYVRAPLYNFVCVLRSTGNFKENKKKMRIKNEGI